MQFSCICNMNQKVLFVKEGHIHNKTIKINNNNSFRINLSNNKWKRNIISSTLIKNLFNNKELIYYNSSNNYSNNNNKIKINNNKDNNSQKTLWLKNIKILLKKKKKRAAIKAQFHEYLEVSKIMFLSL